MGNIFINSPQQTINYESNKLNIPRDILWLIINKQPREVIKLVCKQFYECYRDNTCIYKINDPRGLSVIKNRVLHDNVLETLPRDLYRPLYGHIISYIFRSQKLPMCVIENDDSVTLFSYLSTNNKINHEIILNIIGCDACECMYTMLITPGFFDMSARSLLFILNKAKEKNGKVWKLFQNTASFKHILDKDTSKPFNQVLYTAIILFEIYMIIKFRES